MKTIFKSTFYSLTLALFAVVLCFAFVGCGEVSLDREKVTKILDDVEEIMHNPAQVSALSNQAIDNHQAAFDNDEYFKQASAGSYAYYDLTIISYASGITEVNMNDFRKGVTFKTDAQYESQSVYYVLRILDSSSSKVGTMSFECYAFINNDQKQEVQFNIYAISYDLNRSDNVVTSFKSLARRDYNSNNIYGEKYDASNDKGFMITKEEKLAEFTEIFEQDFNAQKDVVKGLAKVEGAKEIVVPKAS